MALDLREKTQKAENHFPSGYSGIAVAALLHHLFISSSSYSHLIRSHLAQGMEIFFLILYIKFISYLLPFCHHIAIYCQKKRLRNFFHWNIYSMMILSSNAPSSFLKVLYLLFLLRDLWIKIFLLKRLYGKYLKRFC